MRMFTAEECRLIDTEARGFLVRLRSMGLIDNEIEEELIDYARIDVCIAGGLTEAKKIAAMGENVIAVSDGNRIKIHLHTPDGEIAKEHLAAMGTMVRWDMEKIEHRKTGPAPENSVHIVTDAAGSLTREEAREFNITLLESYIVMDDRSIPETLVPPDKLYTAMRNGNKVTTAQASNFERHQYDYLETLRGGGLGRLRQGPASDRPIEQGLAGGMTVFGQQAHERHH